MTLQKVVWAEGMVLGQQHFQAWDSYVEKSQQLFNVAVAPLGWGFSHLDIDEESLKSGVFRIRKFTAVFPCGNLVQYDFSASSPLSCEISTSDGNQISIYIGLPFNSGVSGISGYSTNGQLCRWEANYERVADQYDNSREREILLARHNLSLFKGESAGDQFSILKVAEITSDGNDDFSLSNGFIPTSCRLGATTQLKFEIQRLADLFAAKAKILKDRIRQYGSRVGDYGPNELSSFLLLQVLNPAAAELRHFHENSEIHPANLYRSLIRIASVLQCYQQNTELNDLPAYDHKNLSDVFYKIVKMLRASIDAVMPSMTMGMKLQRESEVLYSVDSIDIVQLDKASFYLAVSMDSDDITWFKELPRKVKVGARPDIEMILASAMPGVRLTHTQRPPNRLPIKSGYENFRLEQKGTYWDRVLEERSIALFLTREFASATVELISVEE